MKNFAYGIVLSLGFLALVGYMVLPKEADMALFVLSIGALMAVLSRK